MVADNRVNVAEILDDLVKSTDGTNLRNSKCLDGEEADDGRNDESVEVVGKECSLDAANESVQNDTNGKKEGGRNDVHTSPIDISLLFTIEIEK